MTVPQDQKMPTGPVNRVVVHFSVVVPDSSTSMAINPVNMPASFVQLKRLATVLMTIVTG